MRFVVTGLDVGGKVVVRTANERIGGRIQSIGEQGFTIVHGGQSQGEELRYRDVRRPTNVTLPPMVAKDDEEGQLEIVAERLNIHGKDSGCQPRHRLKPLAIRFRFWLR